MKTCSRCGRPKDLDEFRKDRSRPDGRRNVCKVCYAGEVSAAYKANPGSKLASQTEYRDRNREALRKAERERLAAMSEAEREVVRKRSRDWTRSHPTRVAARVRAYRATETGRLAHAEGNSRRRAQKLQGTLPEKVPAELVQALFAWYGDVCFYCGKGGQLTLDHYVSLKAGGAHALPNLVPSCPRCNSSKRDAEPLAWMLREGLAPRKPDTAGWPDE